MQESDEFGSEIKLLMMRFLILNIFVNGINI